MRTTRAAIVLAAVGVAFVLSAPRPWAAQAEPNQADRARIAQSELQQAEKDVPKLVPVLEVERGMTVADVGAGGGAMTVVLAKWLGPTGRVYATDIAARQLANIREFVARERLDNVVVVEGTDRSANLPDACCDAIFMRDVYHHFTHVEEMNRSLAAALKPGGRLAIIDFPPERGSTTPEGVPSNRGGHGVTPAIVVDEVPASGLKHEKTIEQWPPDGEKGRFFLVLFRKP